MSFLQDITKANLKQFGVEGLSYTLPVSTTKWIDQDSTNPGLSLSESQLRLSAATQNWLAPFSGLLNGINTSDKKMSVSLQQADGNMLQETGLLLRLFPQQVLRMKRLLALKLESDGNHNPERVNGIPTRQVPAFVFLATANISGISEGLISAGTDMGASGALSFYDEQGHILHPAYVASLVRFLLDEYPALNCSATAADQLNSIISSSAGDANTVRLIDAAGKPYSGLHLEGVTEIETDSGLFRLNTYSGSDSSLKGSVSRSAATAADGSFPPLQAEQLVLGNVSTGRYSDTVPVLKIAAGASLQKDFLTIRILELDTYLKGKPDNTFNGSKLEPKPALRLHEQLRLLTNGNAIMGQLSSVFDGAPTESMCAATIMDEQLPLPLPGAELLWPGFPPLPAPGTVTDENNRFPSGLKAQIVRFSKADFLPAAGGAQPTDILLQLNGLPFGAAIRVYNRKFLDDSVIARGDGAGAVCMAESTPDSERTLNGSVQLVLKDPLGLKRPDGTVTVPTDPQLIFDLVIVLNNRKKRLFGALTLPVQQNAVTVSSLPDNILASLSRKSVSRAGILGLSNNAATIDFSSMDTTLNNILALVQEQQPRDPGRLPTMMRRELLAAAKKGNDWHGVLGAGPITGQLHNAEQDLGCPGSPGGPETANTGIATQGARLAYDIARMSFRRTSSLYDRLQPLSEDRWNEPAANTPLGASETATAARGTFAGVLAQNIAPYCETPELALLKSLVETHIDSIPAQFDDLVDLVKQWITNLNSSGLPSLLDTAAGKLKTILADKLEELKDNNTLSESSKERLYLELKRELSSACFGRRDSQWALQQAIRQARHAIYIETPGFSFTQSGNPNPATVDLVALLAEQLQAKPGLRVIICVPKQPGYQERYDQWIRSEIHERWQLATQLPAAQVLFFHPIGFPGRHSDLEQHTVIIDDQWVLCGSSAFRRRGLCFDGSSDMIFTDLSQKNGYAPSLRDFRIALMKQRLGVPGTDNSSSRTLMLHDFALAFDQIRQTLIAGGLGKVSRLWNGHTAGITYSPPSIDREVANPDGLSFNLLPAALFAAFSGLGT